MLGRHPATGRPARRAAGDLPPVAVALAGLAALAVAVGIGRFAFTPILPMMQADAGLSVQAGAGLAAGNYAGYLAGSAAAIWLRLPAGTAVRAGLAAIGLTTLGMAFVSGLGAWMLLRTLAGIASAVVLIFVSASCLERLAAAGRPGLAGVVFGGVGSGIAVAGAACLVLMHRGQTSADAWLALGVLSIVATGVVWPVFRPGSAGRAEARRAADPEPRWDRDALRLVVCYGAWGFGYIIPATFLPAMARQLVDDPAVFGWAWPVFGTASVAATLAAGAAARSIGPRRLWALSQATMAAGVVMPALRPGIAPIMLAALLVGSTFMVNTMAGMQEARRVHGAAATGLMAAMTAAFASGQIAGPAAAGVLLGAGAGLREALVAASAVLLVSAAVLWTPARPR